MDHVKANYKFVTYARDESRGRVHRLGFRSYPKRIRLSRKKKKWTYKEHRRSIFKIKDMLCMPIKNRDVYRYFYYMAWVNQVKGNN